MIPSTEEIARQLAVMVELHPEKTISEIAAELALSPIFIINAITEGERMELLRRTAKFEDDKLELISPLDLEQHGGYLFGAENDRVQEEIVKLLNNMEHEENDIEKGELEFWFRGVRPSALEISLHVLTQLDIIEAYKLADPKDKKSEYIFYSLRRNANKRWGRKQFKA